MSDKIIEITANDFRKKLQEMVRFELVKQITEASEEEKKIGFDQSTKAEKLLLAIHDLLSSKKVKGNPQDNFKEFSDWIKKHYESDLSLSPSDDTASVLSKYADHFSKEMKPTGKSVKGDLMAFLTTRNMKKKLDKVEAELDKPEIADEPESTVPRGEKVKGAGKTSTVASLDSGALMKDIGDSIGVSKQRVEQILSSVPLGAAANLNVVLKAHVAGDPDYKADGRSIKEIDNVLKMAIKKAKAELMNIIDAAGEMEPEENMITKEHLMDVLKQYGGPTSEDETHAEGLFLEKIAEIMNTNPDDEALQIVNAMVDEDLMKPGENLFKTFQNMVTKAAGDIDPAFFKGSGRRTEKQKEILANVEKELGKYRIGSR